jgi:hydroxymethylbilane synthase
MTASRLVVATRKSALALTQARAFMAELKDLRPELVIDELHVTTTGDRIQDRALNEIGGKGLFIKEIEEAILDGRADIAVHSMKDVPAELAPSLTIACVPKREDPRDVLVTRSGCTLLELPENARVGTSSLRRSVQLARLRPDLSFVPLRGNVDTRLRRCAEGELDAIVLARAGLVRLGLADRATQVLDPTFCLPAIGQGALAIEGRASDALVQALLRVVHHSETAIAVAAERGVMLAVEGSCQVPVAAYAMRVDNELQLSAMLARTDGSHFRKRDATLPWPADEATAYAAGVALGRELRESS